MLKTEDFTSKIPLYVTQKFKVLNHCINHKKPTWLKKQDTQRALHQETHLNILEYMKPINGWVGQVACLSCSFKSRGVAIRVHKCLPLTIGKVIVDEKGFVVCISVL